MNNITISSVTPRTKYLYHVSPAVNRWSIKRRGLLCDFATQQAGPWGRGVWLVTPSRMAWAVDHVIKRWGCDEVVIYRVSVRRGVLRRKWRGVWMAVRDVEASKVEVVGTFSPWVRQVFDGA